MMPMVFVHDSYLGNRLSSYGFNLTVSVTIVSTAAMNTDAILIKYEVETSNKLNWRSHIQPHAHSPTLYRESNDLCQ